MHQPVIEIFSRLLQLPEAERLSVGTVLQYPVLLWPIHWPAIRQHYLQASDKERSAADMLLLFLETGYHKLSGGADFPYGYGPLETIFETWQQGHLHKDTALQKAGTPAVSQLISPVYIQQLGYVIEDQINAHPAQWEAMLLFNHMLLAAIEGLEENETNKTDRARMKTEAVGTLISITTLALVEVPDKRLMDQTVSYGIKVLAMEDEMVPKDIKAHIRHRLGVLHLDPYFFQKNSGNYDTQYRLWQNKLYTYYGDKLAGMKPEDIELPPPVIALKTAESYFREALPFRNGMAKAATLKALAETLHWQLFLKEAIDINELGALVKEAIELFSSRQGFEEQITYLQKLLEWHGIHSDTTTAGTDEATQKMLDAHPEDLLENYGIAILFTKLVSYLDYYSKKDQQKALSLFIKGQQILDIYPSESVSVNFYRKGIELVQNLADPYLAAVIMQPTEAALNAYNDHYVKENLPGDFTYYCGLLTIAFRSTAKNEEGQGLLILEKVMPDMSQNPAWHFIIPLLQYTQASIEIGEAVNQLDMHQNTGKALEFYFDALGHFLAIGHRGQAPELLDRINNLCQTATEKELEVVLAAISVKVIVLEQLDSEAVRQKMLLMLNLLLQRFCKKQPMKAIVLYFLFQLLKGYNFSVLLQSDVTFDQNKIPGSAQLLNRINDLFEALPVKFPWLGKRAIDKDMLLTGYAGNDEKHPGDDPFTQYNNLRIGFDNLYYNHLLGQSLNKQTLLTPEQLQQGLDAETVVWIQYIGPSPDGASAIYNLFVTAETTRFTMGYSKDMPSMKVEFTADGITTIMPVMAVGIAETRRAIVLDEPDNEEASANAVKRLKDQSAVLLGGDIESYLESFFSNGKKHLCIWPHGAFHYLPFHLLPTKSGELLCNKWTITSVPALAMSMHENTPSLIDRNVCVMAMTFTQNNPYKVSKIPDAITLTQPVANLFGTTVWHDDQLTETAFTEKLQSASMIHLFTHGYLNIDAPSFHALFLAPGDGEDGILYAYEIANLNLHHIDLLTLCACESALGRFDTADNLRGLPAAFFMAGVATIIGSLWDAEPTSAAYFFENLYTALKAGATKRNAFKTAQSNTRKLFPAYRDWGAFYYLGK